MANPSLRFKRGTQSAFNSVGLQTGEPAFITDDYNFYIGLNGSSATNKYFGSARYWTKETSSAGSGVNLVEGTSNGAHFITLASPASVGAAVTYYFPASPVATNVLTTDANGVLSWTAALDTLSITNLIIGIGTFTNNVAFTTTTDSTTKDNGALVIEGGVGIEKSLNVGGNFKVSGISTFVGAVTFEGGTITLGDANTDNVVFNADVNSGILPNTDATFDIGDASVSKRWRHASFSGVGTFATGAVIDAIQIGITATNEIDTSSGVLILDSAAGQIQITDNLSVTGVSTFTGAIDANGGADISGGETVLSSATVSDLTATRIVLAGTSGSLVDDSSLTFTDAAGLIVANSGINITGVSTFSTDLVVGGDIRVNGNDIKDNGGTAAITFDGSGNTTITGNLNVNGSTTQVNTTTLTIEDNLIELGKVDGNAPTSDLNKDIGMLLHYFDSAARLGAVFYDDSVSRVVLASRVGESSGVLTVDAGYYANVELQGLFVTDTAGSGEAVISYATIGGVTARHLQNITVDGGTF